MKGVVEGRVPSIIETINARQRICIPQLLAMCNTEIEFAALVAGCNQPQIEEGITATHALQRLDEIQITVVLFSAVLEPEIHRRFGSTGERTRGGQDASQHPGNRALSDCQTHVDLP